MASSTPQLLSRIIPCINGILAGQAVDNLPGDRTANTEGNDFASADPKMDLEAWKGRWFTVCIRGFEHETCILSYWYFRGISASEPKFKLL